MPGGEAFFLLRPKLSLSSNRHLGNSPPSWTLCFKEENEKMHIKKVCKAHPYSKHDTGGQVSSSGVQHASPSTDPVNYSQDGKAIAILLHSEGIFQRKVTLKDSRWKSLSAGRDGCLQRRNSLGDIRRAGGFKSLQWLSFPFQRSKSSC